MTKDSDSLVLGSEWDEAWNPPDQNQMYESFKWSAPWKQIDIQIVCPDNRTSCISDDTGSFNAVKFQFLVGKRLERLQNLICKTEMIQVENIITEREILKISLKSKLKSSACTVLTSNLANEMEELFLKIVPRLPFTSKLAEELFSELLKKDSLMLYRDSSRIYIVGTIELKQIINQKIKDMKHRTTRESLSINEKWKAVGIEKFDIVQSMQAAFPLIYVESKDDFQKIFLEGVVSDVQIALEKCESLLSKLICEKIVIDPLLVQLLKLNEPNQILKDTMQRNCLDVAWVTETDSLCFVSETKLNAKKLRAIINETFLTAGFEMKEAQSSPGEDFLTEHFQKYNNIILVYETIEKYYNVASTKALIREFLNEEHRLMNCSSQGVQGDENKNEIYQKDFQETKLFQEKEDIHEKLPVAKSNIFHPNDFFMWEKKKIEHKDDKINDMQIREKKSKKAGLVTKPPLFLSSSYLDGQISPNRPDELKYTTPAGIIVRVYVGNITQLNVNCIVNASSEDLRFHGGVAEVILRVAGPKLQDECNNYVRRYGKLKVSECITTQAYNLPYKCIIHAAGPRWADYPVDKKACKFNLKQTIINCLHKATGNNMETIAIPAISSGKSGVPKEDCACQYREAVIEYSRNHGHKTSLKEIHFIDKNIEMIRLIKEEFKPRYGWPDPTTKYFSKIFQPM